MDLAVLSRGNREILRFCLRPSQSLRQNWEVSQKLLVARFMAQDPDFSAVFQEMVATLVREVGMNNEQQSRKLLCKSWTRSEIRNRGSFAGAQSHGLFPPRSKSKSRGPTDFAFGLLLSLWR